MLPVIAGLAGTDLLCKRVLRESSFSASLSISFSFSESCLAKIVGDSSILRPIIERRKLIYYL